MEMIQIQTKLYGNDFKNVTKVPIINHNTVLRLVFHDDKPLIKIKI